MSSIDVTKVSLIDRGSNRSGVAVALKGSGIKATEEQIKEIKLWETQRQAREEANRTYALQHPDKVYGQVVVEGKLFATVYDSGVAGTPYPMQMTEDGFGISLAETRLSEIAKAAKGTIIYSDFFPDTGGSFRGAPEALLPPITARSLTEIVREMSWGLERSRMEAASKTE